LDDHGRHRFGFFRSNDGGETWDQVSAGLDGVAPHALRVRAFGRPWERAITSHLSRQKGVEMPLIHVVFVLIIVGVLLWLINSFIPMDQKIKSILNIVVVIAVVIWLLQAFGVMGSISHFRMR
jgi:hypothetical protein